MVTTGSEIKKTEQRMLKTIASASRPLKEDLKLSRLGAIDKLKQLQEKFREQWIGPSPWLVLEDGWTIAAAVPVEKTLALMDEHGEPVGMVGAALLTQSNRIGILQMLFRAKADKKAAQRVQESAEAARQHLPELIRQINPLGNTGKDVS